MNTTKTNEDRLKILEAKVEVHSNMVATHSRRLDEHADALESLTHEIYGRSDSIVARGIRQGTVKLVLSPITVTAWAIGGIGRLITGGDPAENLAKAEAEMAEADAALEQAANEHADGRTANMAAALKRVQAAEKAAEKARKRAGCDRAEQAEAIVAKVQADREAEKAAATAESDPATKPEAVPIDALKAAAAIERARLAEEQAEMKADAEKSARLDRSDDAKAIERAMTGGPVVRGLMGDVVPPAQPTPA